MIMERRVRRNYIQSKKQKQKKTAQKEKWRLRKGAFRMVCQCAIFVFLDCPYNPPYPPLKPPSPTHSLWIPGWLNGWIVDRRHIILCDECDKNFASTFRSNFSSGFYPRVLAGCIFFFKTIPVPQGPQYLSFHDPTHTHMETECTS